MSERHLIDWLVLLAALPVTWACLCRLRVLDPAVHRVSVMALHVALFGSAFGAGVSAWQAQTSLQSVLALVGAGLWIFISRATWAAGVPAYMARRPAAPARTARDGARERVS